MSNDFQMSVRSKDRADKLGIEMSRMDAEPIDVFSFKRTNGIGRLLVMTTDRSATTNNYEAVALGNKGKDKLLEIFQKGSVNTAVRIDQ